MHAHEHDNALIVGGGIGGLTTALALSLHGWRVRVIEQAGELGDIGAGIQLSPNACHVLRALGVLERLMPVAVTPQRIEMVNGLTQKPVFSVPAGAAAQSRWGAPYLHCHRADLVEVLANALREQQPDALSLGVGASSLARSDAGFDLLTDSGERLRAKLIVAADGVRSGLRDSAFKTAPPRFTGNVAWRCTLPTDALGDDAPPAVARAWVGPGRHAVTYRLRGGALTNFVGVVETEHWSDEHWMAEGSKAQALADFHGWHPTLQSILEGASTHYRWALFERSPLTTWSDENFTLLGDAAHAMLPFVAQGAAMAIEDAWVLARCLDIEQRLPEALRRYEQLRIPRTREIQRRAAGNQQRFHARGPLAQWWHWQVPGLVARIAPSLVLRQLDHIYSHNVVAQMKR